MLFLAIVYLIILVVAVIYDGLTKNWPGLPQWVLFAILGYEVFGSVLGAK